MSDNNNTSNHKLYQHKDFTECQGFLATVKAKARLNDDGNVLKVYQLAAQNTPINPAISADLQKKANGILHGILVLNTGNMELLSKLNTDYDDDGVEAIKYIKCCFSAGGNENKEGVARDNYNDLLGKCPNGTTVEEFKTLCDKLKHERAQLKDTDGEITEAAFCLDLRTMVSNTCHEAKMEVRDGLRNLADADKKKATKVQEMLEGVLASLDADRKREKRDSNRMALHTNSTALQADAQAATLNNPEIVAQLAAAVGGWHYNSTLPDKCRHCGRRHNTPPGEQCHALMLSEGKDIPGWDNKPEHVKQRLQDAAKAIKDHGPWSERPENQNGGRGGSGRGGGFGRGGGRGGGKGGKALMTLLTAIAAGKGFTIPPKAIVTPKSLTIAPTSISLALAATNVHGDSITNRFIVDTGNLTGKHLVSNRALFDTININAKRVPVAVATDQITSTAGDGTCNMIALDADGNPTARIELRDCAYVPEFGVNLLSVQLLKSRGANVDIDAGTITFSSGAIAHFGDDFTMSVIPTPNGAYPAVVSCGKHGPTKISVRELTSKQRVEMQLWQVRLNGATAKTLRGLDKIADGAPPLLARADEHNAPSTPRLLADGRRMPAPERPT